jgi:hydroxyacylglutathione hydrolase
MIEVVLRPALQDNIMPFIVWREKGAFWCVDPGDGRVLEDFARAHPDLDGRGVYLTHHHSDHIGGVERWKELFPGTPVLGPPHPRLADVLTTEVSARHTVHLSLETASGDILVWGDGDHPLAPVFVSAIPTPGHTVPAVSYLLESGRERHLFSGDTLFGAGCGRLFEGSPAEMWNSLKKLRALPAESLVVCGHEYTLRNLQFAATLGWRDDEIHWELERVEALRAADQLSLPRRLSLEKETNAFLNADDPALAEALGLQAGTPAEEVFATLRQRRNAF